jgi:hypothetical protein
LGHGSKRDHADVDRDVLGRADPVQRARLQHAQELHLQLDRHLGDLVEEHRAAVRLLEEADVAPLGAGEAAALVAEQLALDQGRRDRAAVHRDQRRFAPPR